MKANSLPPLPSPHSPQPSTPIEIYLAAKTWPGTLGEPRNGRPTLKCHGCHCGLSAWISALLAASAALLVWVSRVPCWSRSKKATGMRKEIRVSVKENVGHLVKLLFSICLKLNFIFYFDFFEKQHSKLAPPFLVWDIMRRRNSITRSLITEVQSHC